MCGRFALGLPSRSLAEHFQLDIFPEFEPRYNIAPTRNVATIAVEKSGREMRMRHWGLIPHWAKDNKIGSRLINARSETAGKKPSFRYAFRHRRCLIPSTGFYEWKRTDRAKQPFFIRMLDEKIFAFAGLWERREGQEEEAIESCTILTTSANDIMRPIHERMPVILNPEDYDIWLDPANINTSSLEQFLKPFPSDMMKQYPVDAYVNNPQNDDPKCIEPLEISNLPRRHGEHRE